MKKPHFKNILFLILSSFVVLGCTEPYALQTNTFEDALVVEATITNELKQQKIRLTRTFRFEDNAPSFEAGASVFIIDDNSNTYPFVADPNTGYYVSTMEFQAMPNRKYRLSVDTADGDHYDSTIETLTTVNEMQDVTATVGTKEGQSGVLINVKSFDPLNSSKFYRYEFEETYKIIAPAWTDFELRLIPPPVPGPPSSYGVELIPRLDESTKTCYPTKKSDVILLETTNGQNEDRQDYTIRFISDQDYIISHRYSILVRQYIQTLPSYTFYKTLKEISGSSGSILSQNQPGFFYGNIKSSLNPDKKVIGFFEVSAVSSKRIFFNYTDLFPTKPLPPYVKDCTGVEYNFCFGPDVCDGPALITGLMLNTLSYFYGVYPKFIMVPIECGDCSSFSSNIIPSFWNEKD